MKNFEKPRAYKNIASSEFIIPSNNYSFCKSCSYYYNILVNKLSSFFN